MMGRKGGKSKRWRWRGRERERKGGGGGKAPAWCFGSDEFYNGWMCQIPAEMHIDGHVNYLFHTVLFYFPSSRVQGPRVNLGFRVLSHRFLER